MSAKLREDFIVKSQEYIKLYGLSDESFDRISIELFDDANYFAKLFKDIPDYLNQYFDIENKKFTAELNTSIRDKNERISEKVFFAIKLKLSLVDKMMLEQVIRYQALHPLQNDMSLDALYRISDTIWSWLGNQEIDFSYYTKRISLSLVITSTLIYYANAENETNIDNYIKAQLAIFSNVAKFKNKICNLLGC